MTILASYSDYGNLMELFTWHYNILMSIFCSFTIFHGFSVMGFLLTALLVFVLCLLIIIYWYKKKRRLRTQSVNEIGDWQDALGWTPPCQKVLQVC